MTKDELKKEFYKYLKDSSDYYDQREPLTERKLLQMWLDSAEPREKRIAEQEELLNSTLEENKEIYKKMADLDTALEDCTESLTDARIKIKELEKENTTLKERNAKLKGMYAHSAREASTYKQFLELKEKENAKLKEKYDTCLRENTGLKIHNAYVEKKLTEANEIIRGLYFIIQGRIDYENNIGIADEMWRAKQFFEGV